MHPEPTFFPSPQAWRAWLVQHHDGETELWVGFYKKGSGRPSLTWPESVAQALCFGWIDGIRRSVDDQAYMIRFTPRRPNSSWSEVNLRTFAELEAQGLVTDAGRAAHARRREDRSGMDAVEGVDDAALSGEQEARLRADPAAWEFFSAQPPWYRRAATRWVISAKREATRERRLDQLIADCAAGRTIPPLTRRR